MTTLAVLLPDNFAGGAVAGALDLLQMANRMQSADQEPFRWRLLTADGREARSWTGLSFAADGRYEEAAQADALWVPGFVYRDLPAYERQLQTSTPLREALRAGAAERRLLACSCTGVPLLAETGLLDGHPATISWWLAPWFSRRYPKVDLRTHAILTEAPDRLCSGATTAYLNLALRLVERFAGPDLALACAQRMLVDMHRTSQAPYTTLQQYSGHNDPIVSRCQQRLGERMAEPFDLQALASDLGVSERTLMRRFRRAIGDTPLHYLQQMRLYAARRLLESSALSLEQIVAEVGYSDVSSFRRLFKRELKCAPGEYRRRFAPA